MSNTNEKTTAQAPRATARPTGVAVVQPASVAPDKFHGKGGLYTVVNGVRQRVDVATPKEAA